MQAGHRQLRVGRVGQAHAADPAVAPGLLDDPGQGVETVLTLGRVFGERAFGGVAPTAVLEDRDKALLGKPCGHLCTGDVLAVELFFRARGLAFVVGRAFDHHRKRPFAARWQVDIGGQVDAVTHRDHLVRQNLHADNTHRFSTRSSPQWPATPSPARRRSGTAAGCNAPIGPSRHWRWPTAPAGRWRWG